MAAWPAYPAWHPLVTAVCVVAGVIWLLLIGSSASLPDQTAPPPDIYDNVAPLGAFVPELIHQGLRFVAWLRCCVAAALSTRLGETWRQIIEPYPKNIWQISLTSVVVGVLPMACVGDIALHHNPQGEYSDISLFAVLCLVYFAIGFLALELPHQLIRLIIWLGRMSGNALRYCRG